VQADARPRSAAAAAALRAGHRHHPSLLSPEQVKPMDDRRAAVASRRTGPYHGERGGNPERMLTGRVAGRPGASPARA
jgi:hypothetical protein